MPPLLEFSSPALERDTAYPLSSAPKTHRWHLLLLHSSLLWQVNKGKVIGTNNNTRGRKKRDGTIENGT